MEVTVVFSGDKLTQSKKLAIEMAKHQGATESNGMYTVKFDNKCQALTKLLDLCHSWKLSEVIINEKHLPATVVYNVLLCDDNDECEGMCQRGYPSDICLIEELELLKNDDDDCDLDWIQEAIQDLDSFEKQPDGSFKINKAKFKSHIEKKYEIPIAVCEKFDLNKVFTRFDKLPDVFSIPKSNKEDTEDNSVEFPQFGFTEKEKMMMKKAKIVAPIFARAIAQEMDKVIIANFGPEKDRHSCERKADCLFELRRYDESVECFDKALTFDNKNVLLLFGKALAQYYNEKFQDALDTIEAYLAIEQKIPEYGR